MIMKLYNRKPKFDEVRQYVEDLDTITLLRDKCKGVAEQGRYDTIIEVMQLVLTRISEVR